MNILNYTPYIDIIDLRSIIRINKIRIMFNILKEDKF